MKRIIALFIIGVLFLAVGEPAAAGSGNRTGTGGASQLLIPVGARDLAMGGSTISTTYGIEALFWNPAGAPNGMCGGPGKPMGVPVIGMPYCGTVTPDR